MNFGEMIDAGNAKSGSLNKLGEHLGVSYQNLVGTKACRRRMTDEACLKLAVLLGISFEEVIRSQKSWLAKNEEDRKFWQTYGRAAGFAMAVITGVNFFVTPSPAEAAPLQDSNARTMCIMLSYG